MVPGPVNTMANASAVSSTLNHTESLGLSTLKLGCLSMACRVLKPHTVITNAVATGLSRPHRRKTPAASCRVGIMIDKAEPNV